MAEWQGPGVPPGCPGTTIQGSVQEQPALGTATASSPIGWDASWLEHSSGGGGSSSAGASAGGGGQLPWLQAAEQAQLCSELDLTEPPETPVRASGSDWNFRHHFAAEDAAAGSSGQSVQSEGAEQPAALLPATAALVARQAAEQALMYGWRPQDAAPAGGGHWDAVGWHRLLPQAPPDRPAVSEERLPADGGSKRKAASGGRSCASLGSAIRRLWRKALAVGRPAQPCT